MSFSRIVPFVNSLALVAALFVVVACEQIDNYRIPAAPVNIELTNQGLWDTYGVHSFGQYRMFIRELHQPSNYSYTANTYTGFGGILLISGYFNGDYNVPLAYDLACPVEVKNNIRVTIDPENHQAVCPTCGSRFDVTEGEGRPVSGKALEMKCGMQRYHAYPAQYGGYLIAR